MPRGDLRTEVLSWLRHRHRKRLPRSRGADRRGQIPDMLSIHQRPQDVQLRLLPGHWEGDTLKGKYNRSAVGFMVERSTLFTVLAKLNGVTAQDALTGFSRVLKRIEASMRCSLTYDRGKELACHKKLAANTQMPVFFADPRSLAARRQ